MDDLFSDFYAEIATVEAHTAQQPAVEEPEEPAEEAPAPQPAPGLSRPATHAGHHNGQPSTSKGPQQKPPHQQKPQQPSGPRVGLVRTAAGERWIDTKLADWPDDDFRIFVGNLGTEVTDQTLAAAFQQYTSFQRCRVVRNAHTNKCKGFGFVSMSDPVEGARAMREVHGKYIGSRPCQLKRSKVEARTVTDRKGRPKKREVPDRPQKPSKRAAPAQPRRGAR